MKRQLEPIDLMVAVGLFATVLGGLGLFVVTRGSVEAGSFGPVGAEQSVGEARHHVDPMQWVQPALGEALVTASRLEREAYQETIAAAAEFHRARLVNDQLHASPFAYIERIGDHARLVEVDHLARLQFVMGRRITDATARGIRAGIYQLPVLGDRHNRRMIRSVELYAARLNDRYRSAHEPLLGAEIVAATQAHERLKGQVQQRLGSAVVQGILVREHYGNALAGAQEQLATVALASIHQDLIADRFARLAIADSRPANQGAFFAGPRSWPDIPTGIMVASFFGLIGIFCIGLSTPRRRRGAHAESVALREPAMESRARRYHKTAA